MVNGINTVEFTGYLPKRAECPDSLEHGTLKRADACQVVVVILDFYQYVLFIAFP